MKHLPLLFLLLSTSPIFAQWNVSSTDEDCCFMTILDLSFGGNKTVGLMDISTKLFVSSDNGGTLFTGSLPINQKVNPQAGRYLSRAFQILNDSIFFVALVDYSYTNLIVSRTQDYGATWEDLRLEKPNQDTLGHYQIEALHFWENGKGFVWVSGDSSSPCESIYTTDNFGDSWSLLNCADVPVSGTNGVGRPAMLLQHTFDDKLLIRHPTNLSSLIEFSNYGNTVYEHLLDTLSVKAFAFRDSLNGLFHNTDEGTFYRTTDKGKTFKKLNTSLPSSFNKITYAPATSNKQGFYMAYGGEGAYMSKNDGESWEFVDNLGYVTVGFQNAEFGIALIATNPLSPLSDIHYSRGFSTEVKKIAFSSTLLNLYPNPTQTELFIENIQKGSPYQLYSPLGAKLAQGLYDGNSVSVSGLPSGVYFLRIQTQEGSKQARFVKE